jgi:hypothetical protein
MAVPLRSANGANFFGREAFMVHLVQVVGLVSSATGLFLLYDEALKARGARRALLWLAVLSGIAVTACH